MTCQVCHFFAARERLETCDADCEALRCMAQVQAQTDAMYPEAGWVADERAQLLWEFKARWHQVRGLEFKEPPPKTAVMRQFEMEDLLMGAKP